MAKYKWRATPQALRNIAILIALLLIIIFMIASGINKAIKNSIARRQYKTLSKEIQVTVNDYAAEGLTYPSGGMNTAVTTSLPSSVTEYLWLYANKADLPAGTVELGQKNIRFAHFLYQYGNGATSPSKPNIPESEYTDQVPTFYQWDERWGFVPYGDSVIGVCGSGPVMMSMAIMYITGNAAATPAAVAAYAEDDGLYYENYGSAWGLVPYAADEFGLYYEEVILDGEALKDELDEGRLVAIVVGKGDFTKDQSGFLLLTGYTNEGFIIRDPFSEANTNKVWKFDDLSKDIVAIWALWD